MLLAVKGAYGKGPRDTAEIRFCRVMHKKIELAIEVKFYLDFH